MIGMGIVAKWEYFGAISSLDNKLVGIGFICLLAIPVVAILLSGLLKESLLLQRQMEEEAQIAGVTIRTKQNEQIEQSVKEQPAVTITGPMTFNTAGYDWFWSDFYKNTAVFGQSGSGKTICVLNALLDGLIGSSSAAKLPAAALILDPKGDFRDKINYLCSAHNRSADLLMIDPYNVDDSMHWNPLDSDDDAIELAGRFGSVMEILNPSKGNDRFWIDSSVRLIQNLITVLRHAHPDTPPSLPTIYQLAMNDKKLESVCDLISHEAYEDHPVIKQTFDYIVDVWKPMPDETKATVRSFVSNMIGNFLSEPYDKLFSGHSSKRIADILEGGKILYVYMPLADKQIMSRVVCTFVKLEFYREVLKRTGKERPSFFLCDEFQSFFTTGSGRGDADAFELTRASNHANIVAFQNLNSLYKQTESRESVMTMLGNCAIKIFLRNTEKETNEYASDLFGEHIETLSSTSTSVAGNPKQNMHAGTVSGSAQYSARIKKDSFAHLKVPSKEDSNLFAESMNHLASRSQVESRKLQWKVHPLQDK